MLGLGDIGAQHIASDHKYDPKRTAKMAVIGTFLVGPHVYTYVCYFLERWRGEEDDDDDEEDEEDEGEEEEEEDEDEDEEEEDEY